MDNRFNELQKKAYNTIVYERKSCFITGSGGTGKSFLIKQLKIDLEAKYYRRCDVTSTTGISASLIEGVTIHRLLGIRLGTGSYKALYKMITENRKVLSRWKALEVLIIDEVSMLTIELFEKLEKLARVLRKCDLPFGGIQIVLVGDFLQLRNPEHTKYIFESSIWNAVISTTIVLNQIMRQSDEVFQRVLNKVRFGKIDDEVKEVLKSREIKYNSKDGFIPTALYTTNAKVDAINKKYYDKLDSPEYKYSIKFKYYKNVVYREEYEHLIRFESELTLKIGCQVVYCTNNIEGLCNGSRGIIIGFIGGLPNVLFSNGIEMIISPETLDIEKQDEVIFSYTQIPLKLAWCMTIHKSQGSTLSLLRVDLKNIFEYSQFYVGISRAVSLDGLYLRNLDFNTIKVHPKALEFYTNNK